MSSFSNTQERKKEVKEKDKVRREKLAGYFFDLSKLAFAGLVIGGIVSLKEDANVIGLEILKTLFGCITALIFAKIANEILK